MAALVTDRFRVYNAKSFIDRIDTDGGKLYLFIGRPYPWAGTDLEPDADDNYPPIPLDTVKETDYEHWEAMIASKKIQPSDVAFVIPRNDWSDKAEENVFKAYTDDDNLLHSLEPSMTLTTQGTDGDFRVYKCVTAPTDGSNALTKPVSDGDSNGYVDAGNGYVFKVMYKLNSNDVLKFLTPQHVPVGGPSQGTYGINHEPEGNLILGKAYNEKDPIDQDGQRGHGGGLESTVRELGAYYVAINTKLEYDEVGKFTTENDFRQIGLLVNPKEWDNTVANADRYRQTTRLVVSSAPGFRIDDIVLDDNTNERIGRVIEVAQENDPIENVLYIQFDPEKGSAEAPTITPGTTSLKSERDETITTTVQAGGMENRGLKRYTGDVLYIENRQPIPRAPDQTESLTIILEF